MKNLNRKNELITKNETFLVESFLVISSFFRFRFFIDRKSTRLNSSHDQISYAVFCLKKKTNADRQPAASRPRFLDQRARLLVGDQPRRRALIADAHTTLSFSSPPPAGGPPSLLARAR